MSSRLQFALFVKNLACCAIGGFATLAFIARGVQAAELKVLSAGALRSIATELAERFGNETGHRVALSFGTAGELRERAAVEAADVLIVTDAVLEQLRTTGLLAAGAPTRLASTGIGVAVRAGAPMPDVSTPEALRRALLACKSLVYPDPAKGATAGIHAASVLQRLGIADAVRGKAVLVPAGLGVGEAIAKGEAELGVTQISEIVPAAGVALVGALPGDLQKVTVYSAAIFARAADPEVGRAFVAYLAQPALRDRFAAAGLAHPKGPGSEPPPVGTPRGSAPLR